MFGAALRLAGTEQVVRPVALRRAAAAGGGTEGRDACARVKSVLDAGASGGPSSSSTALALTSPAVTSRLLKPLKDSFSAARRGAVEQGSRERALGAKEESLTSLAVTLSEREAAVEAREEAIAVRERALAAEPSLGLPDGREEGFGTVVDYHDARAS